ncbi:MAG: hypothetical protein CL678_15915 [Bdellovibrionaceae bacterium]|nr:hypothetical protein [Pseudobdellovibrionaceae bacterium]
MLLFKSDWRSYPSAIVDTQTTNETFIRIVDVYRQMGIANRFWPLALIQPELQGVDPHGPDLTLDQKIKIAYECRYNIWYFLREVVRIPPVAGPVPRKYECNRGNLAMVWSFLNNVDFALIQPRQTGKSVAADCLMVWILYIAASNTRINMVTKDDSLRRANVERLKKIRNLLPKFLLSTTKADSDNQYELTCKALVNVYGTNVAQSSEAAANNLGRGLTAPVSQFDEGPFISFIGTTLPAELAAATAAREEAEQYGRPYGNLFTTTAGKKDDRDGGYMYKFITDGSTWNEIYYDAANKVELYTILKNNRKGKKNIINGTFSHRQLGKTDEWLYNAIVDANSMGDAANRDFFNVWTSGTQSSPLTPELNAKVRDSGKDPVYNTLSKDMYLVRWYVPEEELRQLVKEGCPFIMGLDTSEAVGRDAISMNIINARTAEVIGTGDYNETNLIRFANFLGDTLVEYPNITMIPEKKSTGQMIVDSLLITLPRKNIDPFQRIFNRIVQNPDERPDDYREIKKPMHTRSPEIYDRLKRFFGFNTTSDSRTVLFTTVLQEMAKRAGDVVNDANLITEILGLVVKNERIDHTASGHDDAVIAWLLGGWLMMFGKNLSHYGIPTGTVMSDVKRQGVVADPVKQNEDKYQAELLEKIEGIVEQLKRRDLSEFAIVKMEHSLRAAVAKLTDDQNDVVNIDSLIESTREDRRVASTPARRGLGTIHRGFGAGDGYRTIM